VKPLPFLCLLLFAALDRSSGQAVRLDSAALAPDARHGTWSATGGNLTLMGTWTAVPDTAHNTVTGTWTLMDAQGKTAAFGGWSAVKANDRWTGAWRANVTGRGGEYSGTWTSSTDLKPTTKFVDLFEKAAQTIVSGAWSSGALSGAWSIRAAAK
jgi:hypothetical protein